MLDVLWEDNHCLVLNKPARLLTVGDDTGDDNLLDQAKAYLKQKFNKPGDVYLGVVQRLDRPVSGVVLFARTSKAAARFNEQFRTHSLAKNYWAIVTGSVPQRAASLEDWLLKDNAANHVTVVSAQTPGAKECRLSYTTVGASSPQTLLEIALQTGRSHQIRVQLSSRGMSIVGDKKYGSGIGCEGQILLHAHRLAFTHPTLKTPVEVTAPVPANWKKWAQPALLPAMR